MENSVREESVCNTYAFNDTYLIRLQVLLPNLNSSNAGILTTYTCIGTYTYWVRIS